MLRKSQNIGKLILRIAIGGLMLFHGVAKLLHGVGWIEENLSALGLPTILAYGVYAGELIAPAMLLVGFLTRPAALVVAVDMLAAIVLAHRTSLVSLTPSGGWRIELEMLFLLGAVAIFFLGPGKYSMTEARSSRDWV